MTAEKEPLQKIEERLDYRFHDPDLLKLALTHPSYAHEHPKEGHKEHHNQRRLRATLVRTTTLAALARELELGPALRLGRGEKEGGGDRRAANLCDALEALVGALYLDGGLEAVWSRLEPWFERRAEEILKAQSYVDAKSRLQEWAQATLGETPVYRIVDEHGPDHAKTFTAQVVVGSEVAGEGTGGSKRMAEQEAARQALARYTGHVASVEGILNDDAV